jgi:hypothetical protein
MPEQLNHDQAVARALAIMAAIAEDRDHDVDTLLQTLAWDSLTAVVRSLAGLTVNTLALLRGLDYETPEGRQAVAEQARRLVLRELGDG